MSFRSAHVFAFLLFTVVCVPAQGSGNGSGAGSSVFVASMPRPAGATVRGRVIYGDTGRPVRFATVDLVLERKDGPNIAVVGGGFAGTRTDENGEFTIRNVQPGTYRADFGPTSGLLTRASLNYLPISENTKLNQYFETFEVAGLGEIAVTVRAYRAAAISGRLTYSDGEPAAGVRVDAVRKSGSGFVGTGYSPNAVLTDDRGIYRIKGLPEGEYAIMAIEPFSHRADDGEVRGSYGFQTSILRTYYPEGERLDGATTVKVLLGDEITAIDFSLPERRLFSISGSLAYKPTKESLGDFNVVFRRIDNIDRSASNPIVPTETVTTRKDGTWSIRNLPKGKYLLSFREGYRPPEANAKDKPKRNYTVVLKEIEIADRDVSGVDIEVAAGSSVAGVFKEENGADLGPGFGIFLTDEVSRQNTSPDMNAMRMRPDPAAKAGPMPIRFSNLAAGKYRIRVMSSEFYLVSATLNGIDIISQPLPVEEGKELTGLTVVVSKAMGTIAGQIENPDPARTFMALALAPGATVNSASAVARVDANGRFRLRVKPGEYRVILLAVAPQRDRDAANAAMEEARRNGRDIMARANETVNVSLQIPP